jgi:hypothetical protein
MPPVSVQLLTYGRQPLNSRLCHLRPSKPRSPQPAGATHVSTADSGGRSRVHVLTWGPQRREGGSGMGEPRVLAREDNVAVALGVRTAVVKCAKRGSVLVTEVSVTSIRCHIWDTRADP